MPPLSHRRMKLGDSLGWGLRPEDPHGSPGRESVWRHASHGVTHWSGQRRLYLRGRKLESKSGFSSQWGRLGQAAQTFRILLVPSFVQLCSTENVEFILGKFLGVLRRKEALSCLPVCQREGTAALGAPHQPARLLETAPTHRARTHGHPPGPWQRPHWRWVSEAGSKGRGRSCCSVQW